MNYTHAIPISKLRQQATQAIRQVVEKQMPMVILQRSTPRAVLVDLDYFQSLEEAVFDLTDAKEAEKAKGEKARSLSAYLKDRWGSPKT